VTAGDGADVGTADTGTAAGTQTVPGGAGPGSELPPERLFDELGDRGRSLGSVLLFPVLAVVTALLISGVIIALSDLDNLRRLGDEPLDAIGDMLSNIGDAYRALLRGSVGSLQAISNTLNAATPLILTGLAVAIAFQAGLFNIGGTGQFLLGGMAAVAVATRVTGLPGLLTLVLAVVAGALGGALWGFIPGFLRARTGAHEVITTIMLNFVAINLTLWLLKTSLFQTPGRDDPVSRTIEADTRLPRLLGFLDRPELRVHLGLLIAVAAVFGMHWLLTRSTLGFQFRAVGSSPSAARYGGMWTSLSIVLALSIGGALAGLAGAGQMLGEQYRAFPGFAGNLGFDGITVALLGRSNPFGVLVAALLFGALRAGGQEMQAASNVPIDLILVVQALIVLFIAAPPLIRAIWRVKTPEQAQKLQKGWST
jgi:general nucleoside transport system permease protein